MLFLFPSHYSVLMCLYKCTSFATRYVNFCSSFSLFEWNVKRKYKPIVCCVLCFFRLLEVKKNSVEGNDDWNGTEQNGTVRNGEAKINACKTGTTITCIEQLIVLKSVVSCDHVILMGGSTERAFIVQRMRFTRIRNNSVVFFLLTIEFRFFSAFQTKKDSEMFMEFYSFAIMDEKKSLYGIFAHQINVYMVLCVTDGIMECFLFRCTRAKPTEKEDRMPY